MPSRLPIVNKSRKPKFELHLHIYDLNNVPLTNGTSSVKWNISHSVHGEHRGRTSKCPIDNTRHHVTYNYNKVIPVRISIDRNNLLTDCFIEFEVVQEFPMSGVGRDEKMTLGQVKLNLSEYVEESENFARSPVTKKAKASLEHARETILAPVFGSSRRLSVSSTTETEQHSPTSTSKPGSVLLPEQGASDEDEAEEGIVRRYLMQDSKVNSTLKIGLLMVQVDGDRNYVAPALKTAPMFGSIAGFMVGDTAEAVDDGSLAAGAAASVTTSNKGRDANEVQDMYRRALAASWNCQPGELAADECIEDIFSGGDGWKTNRPAVNQHHARSRATTSDPELGQSHAANGSSGSASGDEGAGGTLRPSDVKKLRHHMFRHHGRKHSNSSEKSFATVTGGDVSSKQRNKSFEHLANKLVNRGGGHRRNHSKEEGTSTPQTGSEARPSGLRQRSESSTSLAPTLGSPTDRSSRSNNSEEPQRATRRLQEVDEFEVRDDLVSWALPGTVR